MIDIPAAKRQQLHSVIAALHPYARQPEMRLLPGNYTMTLDVVPLAVVERLHLVESQPRVKRPAAPPPMPTEDKLQNGRPRDDADTLTLNQLLERIAAGDRVALKALYGLVSARLFAVLLRMVRRREVAEDLLQDVFVTIWSKAGLFDVARGNAYAWLFSMTRRKAIDRLRISSREILDEDPEGFRYDAESDRRWTQAESHIALKHGLKSLKPDVHRALQLCYTYGLTHEELAAEMKVPVGTAKSWVRRGLAQLRECLAAHDE